VLIGAPGVNVNERDAVGRSPLLLAIASDNDKIAEFLLNIEGIDVNIADMVSLGNMRFLFPTIGNATPRRCQKEKGRDSEITTLQGRTECECEE
jgi:ankyrin repeat protein